MNQNMQKMFNIVRGGIKQLISSQNNVIILIYVMLKRMHLPSCKNLKGKSYIATLEISICNISVTVIHPFSLREL